MKPFIPGWLDDAGLTPAEFRIYCHLVRRADSQTRIAWPSYQSIMDACKVSHKSVWRIVKSLEDRKLIAKEGKPFGGSCRYRILANSGTTGTIEPSIVSPRESLERSQSFPSCNFNRSPHATSIVSSGEGEGNPIKEIQLRKSKKRPKSEDEELPFQSDRFKQAWTEWRQHRSELRKPLTATSRKALFLKMLSIGEERSISMIRFTIEKGWSGLFEPDEKSSSQAPNRKIMRAGDFSL